MNVQPPRSRSTSCACRKGHRMKFRAVIAICLPIALGSLGANQASAQATNSFAASFRWCSSEPASKTSPSFTLSGVPKGTKIISLTMADLNASYDHGGGDVRYSGKGSIPCGAIASGWTGPFPPGGQVHGYQFTITAKDAKGAELGITTASRNFPE